MKLGAFKMAAEHGWAAIRTNIRNWVEVYFWVPFALLFMWLSVDLHYYMVGRPTGEDPWDWLVGMAPRFAAIVFSIVLTSAMKEAQQTWMTPEQKMERPSLAIIQTICSTVLAIFWSWLLSH